MNYVNAFVRMLLIVISTALWWFGLIPAMQQVGEKLVPGFGYSWGLLFSLYGVSTV